MARNSDNFSETANLSENLAKFESKTPEQIKSVVDNLATKENPPKTPTNLGENSPQTAEILSKYTNEKGDVLFTDKDGKKHIAKKEIVDEWLKTFELNDISQDYIPKLNAQAATALDGKDVKLTFGSLLKVVSRGRAKYIPQIKATLDDADVIFTHEGDFVFAKQMGDTMYFTSIGKDYDTHITIISNAPKRKNAIQKKINEGEVIYQSPNFEQPRYQTFTDERPLTNETDGVNDSTNLAQSQGLGEISKIHSGSEIGGGLFGGTINGIETDENGDIVGFNPSKFLQGFAVGAGGSLAVRKSLQHFAKKQAQIYPDIAKDNPRLMAKIAQKTLKFKANTAAYNAMRDFIKKSGILRQIDSSVNPRIIAGEKAAMSGHYEPQRARLKTARDLAAKGTDELEIWENTGWYLDKDGKWKFEINAKGGDIKTIIDDGFRVINLFDGEFTPLGDLLDDEKLFKAYPELRNLRVIKSGGGMYDSGEKIIYINTDWGVESAKSTLYHEIQHAVQDIEGFARGGNEDFALGLARKQGQYKNIVKDLKAQNRLEISGDENKRRLAYERLHGEVEARNVEERLKNKVRNRIKPPFLTQDTPRDKTILHFIKTNSFN